MVNFYRRFIPNAGGILAPLDGLLSPKKHSRQKLAWDLKAEQTFRAIKDKLADATILAYLDPEAEISYCC